MYKISRWEQNKLANNGCLWGELGTWEQGRDSNFSLLCLEPMNVLSTQVSAEAGRWVS